MDTESGMSSKALAKAERNKAGYMNIICSFFIRLPSVFVTFLKIQVHFLGENIMFW